MPYIHRINQRTKLITIDFSYTKSKEDEAIIEFYKQSGWQIKPLNRTQSKNASKKIENKVNEISLFADIRKYAKNDAEAKAVKDRYKDIKSGRDRVTNKPIKPKGYFSARKYVIEWRNSTKKWIAEHSKDAKTEEAKTTEENQATEEE